MEFFYEDNKDLKDKVGAAYATQELYGSDETILGEFIGLFAGDGYFVRYPKYYMERIQIAMGIAPPENVAYVEKIIERLFERRPLAWLQRNKYVVITFNKKGIEGMLKKYLSWGGSRKAYTVKLAESIQCYSGDFLIGFVKGLLESDSYMPDNKRRIIFATTSPNLSFQVVGILGRLGIASRLRIHTYKNSTYKPLHRIIINGDSERLLDLTWPYNYPRWWGRRDSNPGL